MTREDHISYIESFSVAGLTIKGLISKLISASQTLIFPLHPPSLRVWELSLSQGKGAEVARGCHHSSGGV